MKEHSGMWDSDPEATKALEDFLATCPWAWPLAKIRCMGHGEGKGPVIGEVWFSQLMELERCVLCLGYWPQRVRRTKDDQEWMEVFLEAGDYGLYSCQEHGTWQADLRYVRQRIEARYLFDRTVTVPVWPPGTMAPPECQFVAEEVDGLSYGTYLALRGLAKREARRIREKRSQTPW